MYNKGMINVRKIIGIFLKRGGTNVRNMHNKGMVNARNMRLYNIGDGQYNELFYQMSG